MSGVFVIDKLSFPIPVCVQMAICILCSDAQHTADSLRFFFLSDGNQKMKERKEDIEQPRDIKQEEKKRKKQF